MSIPFPKFESAISDRKILARGRVMFEEDKISKVEHFEDDDMWELHVNSEQFNRKVYRVYITFEDGEASDFSCNCIYKKTNHSVCKHIVACLYYIRGLETPNDREFFALKKKVKTESQSSQKSPEKETKTATTTFNSQIMHSDRVEREFTCQLCLETMTDPVLMPCQGHSMCRGCVEDLLKHEKKEAKGHKLICCPTCREEGGVMKVRKVANLKVNVELKRIKEAYEAEKNAWSQEIENLSQINKRNQSQEVVKGGKAADNISGLLDKEMENLNTNDLKNIAGKIMLKLHERNVNVSQILEKIQKKNTENSKPNEKKRKADAIQGETVGKYALRSLKNVKTNNHGKA